MLKMFVVVSYAITELSSQKADIKEHEESLTIGHCV